MKIQTKNFNFFRYLIFLDLKNLKIFREKRIFLDIRVFFYSGPYMKFCAEKSDIVCDFMVLATSYSPTNSFDHKTSEKHIRQAGQNRYAGNRGLIRPRLSTYLLWRVGGYVFRMFCNQNYLYVNTKWLGP